MLFNNSRKHTVTRINSMANKASFLFSSRVCGCPLSCVYSVILFEGVSLLVYLFGACAPVGNHGLRMPRLPRINLAVACSAILIVR